MTQAEIDGLLLSAADSEYREFNAKIVNSGLPMIGVRTPYVKSLAKQIARTDSEFFEYYKPSNYEQILLYGFALAAAKMPIERKFDYFDCILPLFDNWAHVDMIVSAFKDLGKNKELFLNRYAYLINGTQFERRVMVVFLMDYCLTEPELDKVFDMFEKMQCDMYYVNMGIAWALSVALVKFYGRTLIKLKSGVFNSFITKKTVQKARESFRIDADKKEELKKFIQSL